MKLSPFPLFFPVKEIERSCCGAFSIQQNAVTAEEAASASEELHAHAEEMKSFVHELSEMVGENAAVSTGRFHAAEPLKAAGHAWRIVAARERSAMIA
jgi:methyl-accepting chemotaxis protein